MKKVKLIATLLVTGICLSGFMPISVQATVINKPKVITFTSEEFKTLLIENVDFDVRDLYGVKFVPLQVIADYTGDKVTYIDDNTVSITRKGVTCTYKVGSPSYTKNGAQINIGYYWLDTYGMPIAEGERFYFRSEVQNKKCTIFKDFNGTIYVPGFSLINDLGYNFVKGNIQNSIYLNEPKGVNGKLKTNDAILNGTLD